MSVEADVLDTNAILYPLSGDSAKAARAFAARYEFPFDDALIAASALDAGCTTLWSEDFQDGQLLENSLRIRNPFPTAVAPD